MAPSITTPPLRGTPPQEGNSPCHSLPVEGWQARPDGAVPKLRFSEFRDAGEWEESQLSQVLIEISNGFNLDQSNDSSGYKVTRIETISNGAIDTGKIGFVKSDQDVSRYRLNAGDILLSNINSLSHIGKSVLIDKDYDLYHGMNLLRLVVNQAENNSHFIFDLLNTEQIRASIKSRANKAVNQASINQAELGRTPVVVPKKKEQQKIAALKTHKKRLMQQLFPAMG